MLFNYTERLFGDHEFSDSNWLPDDDVPDSLTCVLDYAQGTYFEFARANIRAGLAGEKYYEYDYGHGPTRARTQKRLNMARLHVQNELLRVGAPDQEGIAALFKGRGITEHYLNTTVYA